MKPLKFETHLETKIVLDILSDVSNSTYYWPMLFILILIVTCLSFLMTFLCAKQFGFSLPSTTWCPEAKPVKNHCLSYFMLKCCFLFPQGHKARQRATGHERSHPSRWLRLLPEDDARWHGEFVMKGSTLNSSVDLKPESVCHPCRVVSICSVKALPLPSFLSQLLTLLDLLLALLP